MTPADQRDHDRRLQGVDSATLERAVDVVQLLRHPVFAGLVLSVVLTVCGIGVLLVSGLGIRNEVYVSLQLPYVISGGFGALGLIATGACLSSIIGTRRDQAMADEELGEVLQGIAELSRAVVRHRTVVDGGA